MPLARETQALLNDFIIADCPLGEHPMLNTHVRLKDGDRLVLAYSTKPMPPRIETLDIRFGHPSQLPAKLVLDTAYSAAGLLLSKNVTSFLAIPILHGRDVVGVLALDAVRPMVLDDRFVGRAQVLAAVVAYSEFQIGQKIRFVTPDSIKLGQALKKAREEIGLTQAQLAERMNQSRIALSRWESGAQAPSRGPLRGWCEALGLISAGGPGIVTIVDVTPRLLDILRQDPQRLHELSPEQFEHFVADRVERMGYYVTLTGSTTYRDGGIDLIAVPRHAAVGSFLLAGQVKHHSGKQKTGRDAVDRLLSWKDSPFRMGLLVTNTGFTKDALWVAAQSPNKAFLRLRGFEDLKKWLADNLWSPEEWREIPDVVDLAPGISVPVPKPKITNSLDLWPLPPLGPEHDPGDVR